MKRILVPSCDSTNDYALELLRRERPEEGTAVQTPQQTRGRGQRGASWRSEPGRTITASFILYPAFLEPRRLFDLSMAMCLATGDCVAEAAGMSPSIKWPNDVLLAGRKVAGLLIENRIADGRVAASVVGIGLNVNQAAFPPELAGAGSLLTATGREHDLEELFRLLQDRVLARYVELRATPEATRRDYLALLRGLGTEGPFSAGGRRFRGTIEGVDEEGRLLVREAGRPSHAYAPKEIAAEGDSSG